MTREAEVKEERRRRKSDDLSGRRLRLTVNEENLDRENFAYRFVNDVDGRLHNLTVLDDWEVVSDRSGTTKPDGASAGAEVSAQVGGGTKAILLRKPKKYYDEDYARAQRQIDETEKSLKAGNAPDGGDSSGQYVPNGKTNAMTIDRN